MADELITPSTETPAHVPENAPPKRRRRRWPWLLGALAVLIVLFGFFIGSVELLHYTESTAFCSLCHVMKPEYTAYEHSPHARAECGSCHIGPGALPAFQAKLANARYLWVYPLNKYERPIPSPITSLRPVEIVCEQCHWPEKFYQERLIVRPHFGTDEQNSLTRTALLLKTGGGQEAAGLGRGIHWHIANPVYYIATDEKRQNIPWVQAEYNGKVTEYLSTDSALSAADIAGAEKRKMDCVDCHNRASHNFKRPSEALDEALAAGTIAADLPAIKQQGVEVLERSYTTEEEAAQAIAAIAEYYKSAYPDVYSTRQADLQQAIAALQQIFDQTTFPFMNVTWASHPNNIGHKDFPGCFRCHDGKHLSAENEAIRLECNICHSIPEVALPGQSLAAINALPAAEEPETHRSTTWLAEHRFNFDATCATCHTIVNPGGSDNSSFCSNSACHATEWKFAGLNAPKVRELSAPPTVPSTGEPNPIPHPIAEQTDCTICHGPDKVAPAPENHSVFAQDMCTVCHQATLQEGSGDSPAPAAIPHQLTGMDDCKLCHGPEGPKPWPLSHATFTLDLCTQCHAEAAATGGAPEAELPPTIPHDVAGREQCLLCHNPEGGVRPAPADHTGRTNDTCQSCHQSQA